MIKSKFLKNCLALFLITLVAGSALALVNEITKAPIEAAENQARLDAYKAVFEDAEFVDDGLLSNKLGSVNFDCTIDELLTAKDSSGNITGYVMAVTSPSGYGGDIKIAVGISSQSKTITGFTVLSNSETAGLGSKCTEERFKSQFKDKSALTEIKYIKNGGASADDEIDAISGATITTNAVTQAVNTAISAYNIIEEG